MNRVITARRADTCGACGAAIPAGAQINYSGPGGVSCATCPPVAPTGPTRRERREARADRLRGWAGTRETNAAAVFKAGEPFTSDYAFNTQPGHIPFRAKLIAREDAAHASLGKARSMRSRADGIEDQLAATIYDDDPDAIDQLRARITRLERERDEAKAANTAYRKAHRAELAAMDSAYARNQALPYPSYHFTNLSGNIRRQRLRLERLERQAGGGT